MQQLPTSSSGYESAYLEENWPDDPQANVSNIPRKKTRLRQSPHIPRWLWTPLAYSLGIKLSPSDRPVTGLIFYVIMLTSGITFVAAAGFQVVFDVMNKSTKSTVFTESFRVFFGLFWLSIGLYANKLAFSTLTTPALLSCVRLHTKTILKINAGVLISILSVILLILQLNRSSHSFIRAQCIIIDLPGWVCPLAYAGFTVYSVFAAIWNIVVLVLFMTIARTHTIMLRRFIRELEVEGQAKDRVYRLKGKAEGGVNIWPRDETAYFNPMTDWDFENEASPTSPLDTNPQTESVDLDNVAELPDESTLPIDRRSSAVGSLSPNRDPLCPIVIKRFQSLLVSADQTPESYTCFLLSSEDIYNRYWLLEGRLSIVSRIFQRWAMSWLAFVITWTISYVISWISISVSYSDIFIFLIPIHLLSLLCSVYAEVNNEGSRVARSIYPEEGRIGLIRFIINQPLQIGLFNMPVNYTTILSILVAIALTFISKVVMDVFSRKVNP